MRLIVLLLISTGLSACSLSEGTIRLSEDTALLCPSAPRCVSSTMPGDDPHHIEPLRLDLSSTENWQEVIDAVSALPRTTILSQNQTQIHAQSQTPSGLFTDDLELLKASDELLHVRSSSRIGYYDFGANRERVEKLRAILEK